MGKFQKPFIPRPGILDPKPGDPLGYCTNDGMWAAVPFGKKFIIIHNGRQDKVCNTYKQSVDYIKKQVKIHKKKTSSLEEFL
tara:strand:- start:403 stop:648 length:246 start_codon:yes stop_codon:yes gene_type:complete